MVSDAKLLEQYAQSRDAGAFAELVRRHSGLVYSTSLRLTGNAHDAEDVAQQCFMDLARAAASISSSLPAWLHVTATRRSVDAVRSASARRRHEEAAMSKDRASDAQPTWEQVAPHKSSQNHSQVGPVCDWGSELPEEGPFRRPPPPAKALASGGSMRKGTRRQAWAPAAPTKQPTSQMAQAEKVLTSCCLRCRLLPRGAVPLARGHKGLPC